MSSIKFVILASANHLKPRIFIKRLTKLGFFKSSNTVVLTDAPKGKLYRDLSLSKIPIIFTHDNNDIKNNVVELEPDYLVCCGWHSKIPSDIIKLPRILGLNTHNSFLPDYKGASPFKHYWSNWEKRAGAAVHILTDKFDEGNLIVASQIDLRLPTTPVHILKKCSILNAEIFVQAIELTDKGYRGEKQNGGRYFYKLSKWKHIYYWGYNGLAHFFGFQKKETPFRLIT